MDQPVIDFLKREPSVELFLNHVFELVFQSVKTYSDRGFEHLMVSFGCTGGQHRSVYCAQQLAAYLNERCQVAIEIRHVEQDGKYKGQA